MLATNRLSPRARTMPRFRVGPYLLAVLLPLSFLILLFTFFSAATTTPMGARSMMTRQEPPAGLTGDDWQAIREQISPAAVDSLLTDESAKLTPTDPLAGAEFGYHAAIDGDTIVVGAPFQDGVQAGTGAVYVFTRNQGGSDNWGQATKITAPDGNPGDRFGWAVGISGDTIVASAWHNEEAGDHAGAAYIFSRNQSGADNWGLVKKITASDAGEDDEFGRALAIDGDVIVVAAQFEDGGVGDPRPDAGAAYIFTRNTGGPDNWGEVKKITAGDAHPADEFGYAVDISGDLVVVGAPGQDAAAGNAGAAYLFGRNAGAVNNWGQVTKITAGDAQSEDAFGRFVAIDGNTAVVGAPGEDAGGVNAGAAYLFDRSAGGVNNWGQIGKLTAGDAQDGDVFGSNVDIFGDVVAVGAWGEDSAGATAGAVYLFDRHEGGINAFGQIEKLIGSDTEAGDNFGRALAFAGDTLVVGARGEDSDGADAGAAYAFRRVGNAWLEQVKATAGDTQTLDRFGFAVAVADNLVAVGVPFEDGGTLDEGAVYIFSRDQGGVGNWGQVKKITAGDGEMGDRFGWSVDISGNTIIVGAWHDEEAAHHAGAAYIYGRDAGGSNNWGQIRKIFASDAEEDDEFGLAVAIDGNIIVVGAPFENGGPGDPITDTGAAYVYARNLGGANNWGQIARLSASNAQVGSEFGGAVAISGDTIVVGAQYQDGTGSDSGAAYVFKQNQGGADGWGEVAVLAAGDAATDDRFGLDVAVAGDVIAVGVPFEDGATLDMGAVYLYERNQGGVDNWGETAKLVAPDGEQADRFGWSVALAQDTLAVGAWHNEEVGDHAGATYLLGRNQGGPDNWGLVHKVFASDAQDDDEFGRAVALANGVAVVGAEFEDGGPGNPRPDAGAAYIFELAAAPDLRIVKDDGGRDAVPGNTFVYTLTAQNTGLLASANVMLQETVPQNTVFDAAASTAGWSCADGAPAGTMCQFNAGTFPAGSAITDTLFAVVVDNPVSTGTTRIENVATIEDDGSNGPDKDLRDNRSTILTPLRTSQLSALQAVDVVEGGTTSLSGTIDEFIPTTSFTLTVSWGDGISDTYMYASGTTTFTETHSYPDDDPAGTPADPYTVSATLADDYGTVSAAQTTLTVHNAEPVVTGPADMTVMVNRPVTLTGSFTDTGVLDTHTITWDLGDGTVLTGSLAVTHTYTTSGIYTATLAVTDDDTGVGTATVVVTVADNKLFIPFVVRE